MAAAGKKKLPVKSKTKAKSASKPASRAKALVHVKEALERIEKAWKNNH